MRGTQYFAYSRSREVGIIPAHAGNTSLARRLSSVSRDHPRACGEHYSAYQTAISAGGSSPRMRGTLLASSMTAFRGGIIPAHAGNTPPIRVGTRRQLGSSPRMRGTLAVCKGLTGVAGIIPAHAGNTMERWSLLQHSWDHPRACGEHFSQGTRDVFTEGSSPRMRGTHDDIADCHTGLGIIPAHAGNTASTTSRPG